MTIETHTILDGKVYVYKRYNTLKWYCSTFLEGKLRRKSTKKTSLAKAKDFAEDWYLTLKGKQREGELTSGVNFTKVARVFEQEYKAITLGDAALNGFRVIKTALDFIYCPSLVRRPLKI